MPVRADDPLHGLIPAPAGSTFRPLGLCRSAWAHPRACGEHTRRGTEAPARVGSSPRLRGAPRWRPTTRSARRLIPAPAGSTTWEPPTNASEWAHPRACGEHLAGVPVLGGTRGSSPRLRGARHRPVGRGFRHGLIPAPAGSTTARVTVEATPAAHPRACGEHCSEGTRVDRKQGSSPRLRGAQQAVRPGEGWCGLIPAPAGSTTEVTLTKDGREAHPRACGEHIKNVVAGVVSWGSSPRLRGAPRPVDRATSRLGLIPAPAGSTRHLRPTPSASRAHPRACGEHEREDSMTGREGGSSPRLRGAPRRRWW